jgi:hypothetical protein
MATAICTGHTLGNGARSMADTNTKPINLNDVARKVKALRALSQVSNYSLSRTIGQMLDRLNEDDLVKVGELLMSETPQGK